MHKMHMYPEAKFGTIRAAAPFGAQRVQNACTISTHEDDDKRPKWREVRQRSHVATRSGYSKQV